MSMQRKGEKGEKKGNGCLSSILRDKEGGKQGLLEKFLLSRSAEEIEKRGGKMRE